MLAWSSKLATGVPDIDAQHQELFRRAHAADAALGDGRFGAETTELLGYLADYCATHFDMERRLMARAGFPRQAEHAAEHAWFTLALRSLSRDLALGKTEGLAMRLNELVLSWLVKHIDSTDKQLAAYLVACRSVGGEVR